MEARSEGLFAAGKAQTMKRGETSDAESAFLFRLLLLEDMASKEAGGLIETEFFHEVSGSEPGKKRVRTTGGVTNLGPP